MKKSILFILLTALLLSAFSFSVSADDNAQSGGGTAHDAVEGYGWYNTYQYMWKVTVYVGKTDQVTKQGSLTGDFYRIGTVIMKKTGWTLSESAIFGNKIKPDYYSGMPMELVTNYYTVIQDSQCPKIPIACGGDIATVKEYFGSTGTLNTVLSALANAKGVTAYGLLSGKSFTIGGQTKTGWSEKYIMPNGTENMIPWVIVYEPVILMHLKDKVTLCAFTATEFALAQQYGWYDWHYSGGSGQAVGNLPFKHLPTSVQLEESWFGYPVYSVTDNNKSWKAEDIIKGGGWGMRWLSGNGDESSQIDYGCYFTDVETPKPNGYGNVSVVWKNYKNVTGTVLCELYKGSMLLWSGNKTLGPGEAVSQSFRIYYSGSNQQTITIRINYADRNKETDPDDNKKSVVVTPSGEADTDFGVSITEYDENPVAGTTGRVTVKWINSENEAGTVLCELFRDDERVWYEYKEIGALGYIEESYSLYYAGSDQRTITAKINYEHRNEEKDANDNVASVTVTPFHENDTTYDFSVSELKVSPNKVNTGDYATVSFYSDNWNKDKAYDNIIVEVLIDDTVVKREKLSYPAYGRKYHSYSICFTGSENCTVTARINWANRYLEKNADNNSMSVIEKVNRYYDFMIGFVYLSKSETEAGENIIVTFNTDNKDEKNSYTDIPVELLFDGKIVYSENFSYEPYGRKNHKITMNVGNTGGQHEIIARVNWADHENEEKPNNNESRPVYLKVNASRNLMIRYIEPNAGYREGTDVITSFWVYNLNGANILPSEGLNVGFEAYSLENGIKKTIDIQTKTGVVIPENGCNLVWFKWTVPDGFADTEIYCGGYLILGDGMDDSVEDDNESVFSSKAIEYTICTTPDTRYESIKPAGFTVCENPAGRAVYGNWWQYVYENGEITRKDYSVYYSFSKAEIAPATGSSHFRNAWIYTMKSGYGISVSVSGGLKKASGYSEYASDSVTDAQYVTATFPEFGYSVSEGCMRTLERKEDDIVFRENGDYGRVHFTPIWYPDGIYSVYISCSDIWTPGGMIIASKNSDPVNISGSAYDDWYVGR